MIKWGIIGPGNIAAKFAEAVKQMVEADLIAVASRSKERAEVFGKVYGLEESKCYGDYREIVQDDKVDAIYIALPHPFHKEAALLSIHHGKAVLCEKPVTMNEAEVVEVVGAAREKKVFFMEAMKTRFLPVSRKIKELINDGTIGDVRLLQADFGFNAPVDPAGRLFNKELGGGALLDVGIYNLSYSSYYFGNKPVSMKSELYYGTTGVDESSSILLAYENDEHAQLYSSITLNTRREANFLGTEGRICVPIYSNAEQAFIHVKGEERKIHIPFEINGFEYQIREAVQCLQVGKLESELMSWDDSIEVMRLVDRAQK
ncbi:Gfo/Idh/MocA family oxidoreductase [Mesobacillus foraminis]|uniref:Gfo/Idh/MocA family protein n=1 Tax=Mesobacillus foraminis TaxID=279826 RepID=UPI001BEC994C|nr:Gfo/Idh/MocA family oxidoreductase [Mesobacillus foraminis]MBT2758850.1 Gfo/Idh/MocA family oxidoreductase [Mesobacillus foraminis]